MRQVLDLGWCKLPYLRWAELVVMRVRYTYLVQGQFRVRTFSSSRLAVPYW